MTDKERVVIKFFDSRGRQIGEIQLPGPAVEAYNEGVRLSGEEKPTQAIASFQKAIEIEPKYTDAHYNLAVTYYNLGQLEEARKEYEVVLGLRPQDVDALNNLGTILARGGELEMAKEMFDKALGIDSGFALTHRNLAVYYQRSGDVFKTMEHLLRARDLDPLAFDREPGPPRLGPQPY